MVNKKAFSLAAIFIWFLASLFYFYEFFLRVCVSTIADQVMQDLSLSAQTFAIMGAGYYLAYSSMQIPVGILVDRFKPRMLLVIAVIATAIGAGVFGLSHNFFEGFVSRVFMGFGSSFAYVCLLVLALNWFPKSQFGLMVGIANFLGALGPFLAGGPLALILDAFDNRWRIVLNALAIIGFVLAVIIGLFVRNAPARQKGRVIYLDRQKSNLSRRLLSLVSNKQVWFVVLFAGFIYVCLPLLGAYWGTGFLQARGLSRNVAASLSSMLWIGFAIGAPLNGKISDWLKRRRTMMIGASLLGMSVTTFIVYFPTTPIFFFGFLFFCLGYASSSISVAFATVTELVPKNLHATAMGLTNAMITSLPAIIPPLLTLLIGDDANITADEFRQGLFLMPLIFLVSFFLALFGIPETFCRSQSESVKIPR